MRQRNILREIKDFLLHLRLNYNILILSGPFLLWAAYTRILNLSDFILNYAIIYILLFGWANAYNSYFDRDEGPIGGLKNPPKMTQWMYYASWFFQILWWILSWKMGSTYIWLYLTSLLCFWAYSGPFFRLKWNPFMSIIVIWVATFFTVVLLGFLAAWGGEITRHVILGAISTSFIFCSMYPFSQVYQREVDNRRGDMTFAIKYGIRGIKMIFKIFFTLGILWLAYSLNFIPYATPITLIWGICMNVYLWKIVNRIRGEETEYEIIMKIKYFGGVFFTVIILLFIIAQMFLDK